MLSCVAYLVPMCCIEVARQLQILLLYLRDEEYGGQGLNYKYNCAFLEALGHSDSAGIAMAIGVISRCDIKHLTNFFQVQTDCSTPALANFGSEKLKRDFLMPALAGDMVTSIAVLVV